MRGVGGRGVRQSGPHWSILTGTGPPRAAVPVGVDGAGGRPTDRQDAGGGLGRGWLVGIDVGGTFTDGVAIGPAGEMVVAKVASSAADPALGLVAAVDRLIDEGMPGSAVRLAFHGTTIATNAVITGSLAAVTLLATAGATDVLAYRSGRRRHLYDLHQPRPDPLVPAERRIGVAERLRDDGSVHRVLEADEIARLLDVLDGLRPEAIAVCLLFSYRNGDHERRLAEAIRARWPSTPVAISSEVAREIREYPRTVTTVINAGLRPVLDRSLSLATDALRGRLPNARLLVMQSSGGSVPAEQAAQEAHRLLLSGPAGGVAAAVAVSDGEGDGDLIALDMGGTSADVSLIRGGRAQVVSEQDVHGHPVLAPAIDIRTIGAGGGSIVTIDAGGSLRVGPASAGSEPGPASYGRGGILPTVTDAHVVCGVLGGRARLAGTLELDRGRAVEAFAPLASTLGLSVEAAAEAALEVATAGLIRAIRGVTVERGIDPADCRLVAYGGAGPLHAGRLVRELGLSQAIVPITPGLFSARGLLAADIRYDLAQTILARLGGNAETTLVEWFSRSRSELAARLEADGVPPRDRRFEARVDCRYLGQGYELSVPAGSGDRSDTALIAERFHAVHLATYGHAAPEEPVEVVTARLAAFGAMPRLAAAKLRAGGEDPPPEALVEERPILLPGAAGPEPVPVLDRSGLLAGNRVAGPAVIHQLDATTVVLAGQAALVDERGDLRLREAGR